MPRVLPYDHEIKFFPVDQLGFSETTEHSLQNRNSCCKLFHNVSYMFSSYGSRRIRRQMRSQRELRKTIKRIKAFVIICRRNESKRKKHFAFTFHSEDKIETSWCSLFSEVQFLILNSLLQVYLFALILPTRPSGLLMTNWQK